MNEPTPEKEIKAMWVNPDYQVVYKVLGWIVLILIGVLIGQEIYSRAPRDIIWSFGVNVFTSVLSTVFTITVIEILNRDRDRRNTERQYVEDAGSLINEIARNGVNQLRRRDGKDRLMGEDGLLKGRFLFSANLQDVDLNHANLREADLSWANLQGATLDWVDLRSALLREANLQGAKLFAPKLHGADLTGANLLGADLLGVLCDETTILPDGNPYKDVGDFRQFTHPAWL